MIPTDRLTFQTLQPYLFWMGYWLIWVLILSSFQDFDGALWGASVNVGLQACAAYFNVSFLIPEFLEKRKYLVYGLLALTMLVVLTRLHLFLINPEEVTFFKWRRDIRFPRAFQFGRIYLFMVVVLTISTAYKFAVDRLQALQRQSEIARQQLQIELETLKNQINPHFLFNTLNNIYTLTYLKEDNAAPMVMRLSELLRYMLYECQDDKVVLEKEVRFIQNLVAMQQLKSENFEEHIQLEISGVAQRHRIAPLLLLGFLENCFKHSDIESNPNGRISVSLWVSDADELNFSCVNSKKPGADVSERLGGIGLKNIQKRLDLIYPGQYELVIDETDEVYQVYLKLPV